MGAKISFQCDCGQRLRADLSKMGRQFRCPQCRKLVTVPGPVTRTEPPPVKKSSRAKSLLTKKVSVLSIGSIGCGTLLFACCLAGIISNAINPPQQVTSRPAAVPATPAPIVTPAPVQSNAVVPPATAAAAAVMPATLDPATLDTEPCIPVISAIFRGQVISVTDGDTIKVLVDRETVTVRFEGIDSPEHGQDHGTRATQALTSWIKGREVEVHVTGIDRYQRTLAIVMLDGEHINERLVREGWAWQYTDYNCDPKLTQLQEEARADRRGLWAHENAIPPWEFRRLERERVDLARQRAISPPAPTPTPTQSIQSGPTEQVERTHWLNSSSGVRHNRSCRYFGNTKRGRYCGPNEGKACGICGG